jgi:hypothetical protein
MTSSPWPRTAFRRPATSMATALTTSSSAPISAIRPMSSSARRAVLATSCSTALRRGTASESWAGPPWMVPAPASHRPATSMATASTTSSSAPATTISHSSSTARRPASPTWISTT